MNHRLTSPIAIGVAVFTFASVNAFANDDHSKHVGHQNPAKPAVTAQAASAMSDAGAPVPIRWVAPARMRISTAPSTTWFGSVDVELTVDLELEFLGYRRSRGRQSLDQGKERRRGVRAAWLRVGPARCDLERERGGPRRTIVAGRVYNVHVLRGDSG